MATWAAKSPKARVELPTTGASPNKATAAPPAITDAVATLAKPPTPSARCTRHPHRAMMGRFTRTWASGNCGLWSSWLVHGVHQPPSSKVGSMPTAPREMSSASASASAVIKAACCQTQASRISPDRFRAATAVRRARRLAANRASGASKASASCGSASTLTSSVPVQGACRTSACPGSLPLRTSSSRSASVVG